MRAAVGGRRVHRPPPPGRGAICTFQVHTKARRGRRALTELTCPKQATR